VYGGYIRSELFSYLKLGVRSARNVCSFSSLHNCSPVSAPAILAARELRETSPILFFLERSSTKRLRFGRHVVLKFLLEDLARDARDGAISSRSAWHHCLEPPENVFRLIHHTHALSADLAEYALMGHGLADWLDWIRTSTVGGDPAYFGQSGQVFLMRTVFEGKQPQPLYLNSKKRIRTCARL
jgi:hypothetical protein